MLVADRIVLERRIAAAYELARRQSAGSLGSFLDHLVINSSPPRRFKIIRESWQNEVIGPMVPAYEHVAGIRPAYDGPTSFWRGLPRGHNKTSLVADLAVWLLCYSRRPIEIVVGASDRGQAANVLSFMAATIRLNPWLPKVIFKNNEAYGPQGAHLKVLSSDVGSASGLLADVFIVDELTNHRRPRDPLKPSLYEMLLSGKQKRPHAVFVVITNAGIQDTWQHKAFLTALEGHGRTWDTYHAPGHLAGWIKQEDLKQRRKELTTTAYAQLIDNKWIDPTLAGTYVAREEIEACVWPDWSRQARGSSSRQYVVALDYGGTTDPAACAVMHAEILGDVRTKKDSLFVFLDRLHVHQGSTQSRTPMDVLYSWVNDALRDFPVRQLVLDVHQIEELAQHYERQRLPVQRYNFRTGHHTLAKTLRTLIQEARLVAYPDAGRYLTTKGEPDDLVHQFASLITVDLPHRPGEYRVDHLPGRHDDIYTVVALGSLACIQLPAKPATTVRRLKVATEPTRRMSGRR